MKEKQTQIWIPLYVDKWIFGSTRIELEPAERGVFVDLLAFGGKDKGYIRANETTAYHHRQLAGLLNIEVSLLESTIAKCLHFEKLLEPSPGIYLLKNWDNYQLSKGYISMLESGERAMPGTTLLTKSSQVLTKSSPIVEESRVEKKRVEEKKEYPKEFVEFWQAYPKKSGKKAALKAWKKLNPPLAKCLSTLSWQVKTDQWSKDKGQYIPEPATWINGEKWEDEPLRMNATQYRDLSDAEKAAIENRKYEAEMRAKNGK